MPFAVRAAATRYADQRQAKLQPALAAVDEHNDLVKGVLASLGLPGSLDALDNPRGLPDTLATRARAVQQKGG